MIPSQRTQIKDKLKLSNENDLSTQDNLPYKNEWNVFICKLKAEYIYISFVTSLPIIWKW